MSDVLVQQLANLVAALQAGQPNHQPGGHPGGPGRNGPGATLLTRMTHPRVVRKMDRLIKRTEEGETILPLLLLRTICRHSSTTMIC